MASLEIWEWWVKWLANSPHLYMCIYLQGLHVPVFSCGFDTQLLLKQTSEGEVQLCTCQGTAQYVVMVFITLSM